MQGMWKSSGKRYKICPSCGKDNRNFFKKHKILTFFIAFFILAGISGAICNRQLRVIYYVRLE